MFIICVFLILDVFLQGVKEVEETWGNLKFSVLKYVKGTSDRGFILGAVDEVLQILDDNSMQLQGGAFFLFVPVTQTRSESSNTCSLGRTEASNSLKELLCRAETRVPGAEGGGGVWH